MNRKYCLLIAICALNFVVHGQTNFSGPIIYIPSNAEITMACNKDSVYLSGVNGVTKSKPIEAKLEIESRLNQEITFLTNNPKFKGKASLHCLVNCKGETGDFYFLQQSGSEQLDSELIEFFKGITNWQVARLNGATVDSWYYWRIKIKKGQILIE